MLEQTAAQSVELAPVMDVLLDGIGLMRNGGG
jgi:hypothetical protein